MPDLEQFDREMREIEEQIPLAVRDALVGLVAFAFEDIVQNSPVRTGAYRAEHVIGVGQGEHLTQLLYESPDRVGPNRILPGGGTPLAGASPGDARLALQEAPPGRSLTILNQRFYASVIEHGSGSQNPRHVYERARQKVEAVPVIPLTLRVR